MRQFSYREKWKKLLILTDCTDNQGRIRQMILLFEHCCQIA